LYIISGHLARDRSEKGYPSGFLPPVFWQKRTFSIPYPAGIFNERQVFCFSEKEFPCFGRRGLSLFPILQVFSMKGRSSAFRKRSC
jgi:hypothetical protein